MLRFVLLAGALALSACASPGATAPANRAERDCFRNVDVSGYELVDEHHVLLRINSQRRYIVTTQANTRNFDFTNEIAIRSRTSFVCVGDPVGVELIGGRPPFPFRVTDIQRAPVETADQGS